MSSMGLPIGGAGCVFLSWALIFVSAEALPAGEFSAALFGHCLAVIVAWFSLGTSSYPSKFGFLKPVVVITCMSLLLAGTQTGAFSPLGQNSLAGVLGIAVGVSLGFALSLRNPRRTLATFLCISISAILALEGFGAMSAFTVLGVNLIAALSMVLFRLGEDRQSEATVAHPSHHGTIGFRTFDAVLAAVLLSSEAATQYITAWCFALSCSYLIGTLNGTLGPVLSDVYRTERRHKLVAIAARTNLGFLLIGGGGVMFFFLSAQFSLGQTHSNPDLIAPIMMWLFVSHCGPVIMGASDLLMNITRMHAQKSWVLLLWGSMAVGTILFLAPHNPVTFAMWVAAFHIGYSTHLALVLGLRHGVWPGITALMQKELKLT
jgi:hypothetical protein